MKRFSALTLLVGLLFVGSALGQNQSASKTITLQVVPAVSITTSTIPPAVVSQQYSATLIATGGVAPYTWTAAGLPSWLTLTPNTGVLSGAVPNSACTAPVAPATTCPFNFTITVTDSTGTIANLAVKSETLAASSRGPDERQTHALVQ